MIFYRLFDTILSSEPYVTIFRKTSGGETVLGHQVIIGRPDFINPKSFRHVAQGTKWANTDGPWPWALGPNEHSKPCMAQLIPMCEKIMANLIVHQFYS